MGTYAFKLPDIGEGIAESEIAQWRVAVGDRVAEDQPLVDMLTDKAAVELGAPVAGKVLRLHAAAGEHVAVGGVLVTFEVGADAAAEAPVESTSPAVVSPSPAAAPNEAVRAKAAVPAALSKPTNPRPAAAPSVRRRARELGVDLHRVAGSGPDGRILHVDVCDPATVSPAMPATRPSSTKSSEDGVTQTKIIGLRRRIAQAMQRSAQRIPHFAYIEEADVTELEALRLHLNQAHAATRPKLTLLPFLIAALVKSVPAFPKVNSTYDDEAEVLSSHTALHVGIATQTPSGLVVPVLRNAQTLDLWQTASEIARLAEAARTGKATRQELSGSTITVSSLGRLGGIASTPIINAPEVAILGVNKAVERAVVVKGQVVVRTMMNLSASFDHRIVDGFEAASFIHAVVALLEMPATLFIP